MQASTTDLRVVRTKESIREAFIDLIEEKGFEAITVKDITTKAKINRGTFYAHYQDKYDLMTKCEEKILRELTDMIVENYSDILADLNTNQPVTTPFTILTSIFEYIEQNRRFMKGMLGSKGDLSFQTKLKKFVWNSIFESNHHSQHPLIKPEHFLVPPEYLISYVASAHIGVIQQWLHSDSAESPQEMARILSTITINGPFSAAGLKK
ncbi:TetR/AcrR family transcriptional regulator [Lysinibacillus macroides]|uniref:TetR family transcriptional regulator n=1 Tax=Lysinibacillus macroides TaxID=33935 RepID=A0A0M9DKM9_9BACI|nr:TetR/AcrR family transcriptional regulator [Lysinibacillus macroides]KOY82829.1 TetR family transcriptional regulator [Lysinibacillus macroides]QPR66122.1 TetR/AcrR family transcriptional regulator [Lysinibacillus macroides]